MVDDARVERHVEHVMGTAFSFSVFPGALCRDDVLHAISRACVWLHHVDDVFSTWKPESVISRLRRGEISVDECGLEVQGVLELCRVARAASSGWFDPWALPGGLDPTGLVKGWAVREAVSVLKASGARAAMVNGGGDVATFGRPSRDSPWVIGVQDPMDRSQCVAAVASPGAVATSGVYERGAHVLDPRTGRPAETLLSVTVVGPDLALADALATALVAAGERGLQGMAWHRGYSALVIDRQGRLFHTDDLPLVAPSAA